MKSRMSWIFFPILCIQLTVNQAAAYNFAPVDSLISDSISVFRDSVLVMVEKDGRNILTTSRGNIDSLTRMRIASASKWISGAVILACVERGYLSLNDTLGKRLPLFTQQGKGGITIGQCLSMSSGLNGGAKYEAEQFWTFARTVDSIATYTPLAFTPGTHWAYDGKGMQAAGRFAELASGKAWKQLARELILAPCQMDSTDYDYYSWNPWIAGGVQTTPTDYLRFLRMVINNGTVNGLRVLTKASIDIMFSAPNQNVPLWEQASPVFPVNQPSYQYGMDTVKYGFSSWVLTYNPTTQIVGEICSPGYWGMFPWADRCRNLTGVIFMDGGLMGPRAYVTEIALIGLVRSEVGGGCAISATSKRTVPTSKFLKTYKVAIQDNQVVFWGQTAARSYAVDISGRTQQIKARK